MMKEIWKDIIGYEGLYQVSNLGRVKSIGRATTKGKVLKQDVVTNYLRVSLCKNNIRKNYLVHRLVASVFIKHMSADFQVNHKDFNRKNNTPDNLEWVTRKENNQHFRNSEKAKIRDEKTKNILRSMSKISEEDARLINKLRNEYLIKVKTIALIFGIHRSTVAYIVRGRHWSNLKYTEVI